MIATKRKRWSEYEMLSTRGLQENGILADHVGELDFNLAGLKAELFKLAELHKEETMEETPGDLMQLRRLRREREERGDEQVKLVMTKMTDLKEQLADVNLRLSKGISNMLKRAEMKAKHPRVEVKDPFGSFEASLQKIQEAMMKAKSSKLDGLTLDEYLQVCSFFAVEEMSQRDFSYKDSLLNYLGKPKEVGDLIMRAILKNLPVGLVFPGGEKSPVLIDATVIFHSEEKLDDLMTTLEANKMLFVEPAAKKSLLGKRKGPWKGKHRRLPNTFSEEMLESVRRFVESRGFAAQARRRDEIGSESTRAGFFCNEVIQF